MNLHIPSKSFGGPLSRSGSSIDISSNVTLSRTESRLRSSSTTDHLLSSTSLLGDGLDETSSVPRCMEPEREEGWRSGGRSRRLTNWGDLHPLVTHLQSEDPESLPDFYIVHSFTLYDPLWIVRRILSGKTLLKFGKKKRTVLDVVPLSTPILTVNTLKSLMEDKTQSLHMVRKNDIGRWKKIIL